MNGFDEREHLAALRRAFVRGYQLGYFTGMAHGRHGHIDPTPPSGYYEFEEDEVEGSEVTS